MIKCNCVGWNWSTKGELSAYTPVFYIVSNIIKMWLFLYMYFVIINMYWSCNITKGTYSDYLDLAIDQNHFYLFHVLYGSCFEKPSFYSPETFIMKCDVSICDKLCLNEIDICFVVRWTVNIKVWHFKVLLFIHIYTNKH